ncbi:MAG: T9SS type A sorting domain-containing protein [Bacteroidota bacterium]|nr:T9SS type A sorting domain-containing protein [Bacteroidota bacterium]
MKYFRILSILLLIELVCVSPKLYANVFASNIRVTQQGSLAPFDGRFSDGSGVSIRFVLPDHADSVVTTIKVGVTVIKTFTTNNLSKGDTSVVWDGKDNSNAYVGSNSFSLELKTYDKGYATYTTLSDVSISIFTRGVTAITNPNLKNFGFIYTADNGGYAGKGTGVMRHAADGSEWGAVKGAAKLTTTGSAIGSLLRFSSEADEEGYVYLLNRSATAGQVHRYHTDSLKIAIVDSGAQYNTLIQGIGIRGTGSGRYLAIAGYGKVWGFLLGNNATHFKPKDVVLDGDSTVEYFDVAFGRDSMMYSTYYYTAKADSANRTKSGVAKFDLTGYTGTALKLSGALWKTTADTGRTTTMAYYKSPSGVASDVVYYVINAGGSPKTGIYAITGVNATPAIAQIYVDPTGGNSSARSDITIDAVGNVIHFENSTENVAIISPPTGPNNYATNSSFTLSVNNSVISISQAIVDADKNFIPDSLGKTLTVRGIVNSANFQGPAGTQYLIQDDNAGIMVFKFGGGGPTLKVGDQVEVVGGIEQFNGTTEIVPVNFTDITVLGSGNLLTPISLTIPELLANGEKYESRLIKISGLGKKPSSLAWPAAGGSPSMIFWNGWDTLVVRLDKDTPLPGTTEPVYPVNIEGVVTQFSAGPVYNTGYQLSPSWVTDFTAAGALPPNPHFTLKTPANGSTIKLDSVAQVISFSWNKAVDLNGDTATYQWVPIGFTAAATGNGGKDTFIVRTGAQLRTLMAGADTLILKWTVKAKGKEATLVSNVDTVSVKLVKGLITGVESTELLPLVFSLEQNYPNPFNPTTTIMYSIPAESRVTLKIYNMLGQEVATLVNETMVAGRYTASFNASNLASGAYIYRIEAGSFVSNKKMILLK